MNENESDFAIYVNNLSKSYGSFLALKKIDLTVNRAGLDDIRSTIVG